MGNKINAAQYHDFQRRMNALLDRRGRSGKIETYKNTGNSPLNYVKRFNDRVVNCKYNSGEIIAKSFDSLLDLKLQDDLAALIDKHKIRSYQELWKGDTKKSKAFIEDLKAAGIRIDAMTDDWSSVRNPRRGNRHWQVSRVDKDGNVIKDENGNLAQFKFKDFGGDGVLCKNEIYVNELLKIAGYECKTSLNLSDEELAKISSLEGTASDTNLGQQLMGNMADIEVKKQQEAMIEQMRDQAGYKFDPKTGEMLKLDPATGEYVKEGNTGRNSDTRQKVTLVRFQQLVEELLKESRDNNGEATMTEREAVEKISEKYVPDVASGVIMIKNTLVRR